MKHSKRSTLGVTVCQKLLGQGDIGWAVASNGFLLLGNLDVDYPNLSNNATFNNSILMKL